MSPEDKIEKILDDTLAQVQFGSDDATKKMVTALSSYVSTFPNADGKFIMEGSAEYLQRINVIIAEAINNSAYPSAVAQCVRSIEEITELSQQVLTNYNPKVKIDFDRLGVSQIRVAQIETIVNNMTGDSLTAEIRQPIREALQRNVFAGSKLTDTRNYISDFLTKQEGQKYARLTRYAMTWAQDGILQYDGQIYDQFRTTYGTNYIMYIGSLIGDSRPQCIRWVSKFDGKIPVNQLQAEIKWAFTSGSGMNLATTTSSFCTYRGGYRCRHKAIPVFDPDPDDNE
jgi:hypothetical protein